MKKLLKIMPVFLLLFTLTLKAEVPGTAELDSRLEKLWKIQGIPLPSIVNDAAFFRRLSFDVRGTQPSVEELKAFLADKTPGKRARLIDRFLGSEEFARLMAMHYCDMFRVKSEFPINLWPNAVQLFHRYFYEAALKDTPWTQVARELLTTSGSNFRNAPSNFFRANASRSPAGLASGTALALMNFRTEHLTKEDQESFAAFFSRVRFKSTMEWKEEIVYTDPNPAEIKARTPTGENFTIHAPEEDPREVFAGWLTDSSNPILARAYANRAWHWLFGRGLTPVTDDMALPRNFWGKLFSSAPRPNDPADEELLEILCNILQKENFRPKALFRAILNTKAYQADWKCDAKFRAKAEKYFAVYPVRRLESELFCDAIAKLTDGAERYSSVIPEPFTFIPRGTPAVAVADGSITTGLLDNFGRPPRDSGKLEERKNHHTPSQRLYMMNSARLYNNVNRLGDRIRWMPLNNSRKLDHLYLTVLCRYPTAAEKKKAALYEKSMPPRLRWSFLRDVAWALVNSREFCSHH